jgi:hypothetical protein
LFELIDNICKPPTLFVVQLDISELKLETRHDFLEGLA